MKFAHNFIKLLSLSIEHLLKIPGIYPISIFIIFVAFSQNYWPNHIYGWNAQFHNWISSIIH